jgi:hypothetical protein
MISSQFNTLAGENRPSEDANTLHRQARTKLLLINLLQSGGKIATKISYLILQSSANFRRVVLITTGNGREENNREKNQRLSQRSPI